MNLSTLFTEIYNKNKWASTESRSGGGSELGRTAEIQMLLPTLLRDLEVKTFLDAGCGDWNWMSKVILRDIQVQACDIVPDLIARNSILYGFKAKFFVLNLVQEQVPDVDFILCRATLFHLSFANSLKAITNMRKHCTYFAATTHPALAKNTDIQDGEWRRTNLQLEPYNLPEPMYLFCDDPGKDGFLGVWKQ